MAAAMGFARPPRPVPAEAWAGSQAGSPAASGAASPAAAARVLQPRARAASESGTGSASAGSASSAATPRAAADGGMPRASLPGLLPAAAARSLPLSRVAAAGAQDAYPADSPRSTSRTPSGLLRRTSSTRVAPLPPRPDPPTPRQVAATTAAPPLEQAPSLPRAASPALTAAATSPRALSPAPPSRNGSPSLPPVPFSPVSAPTPGALAASLLVRDAASAAEPNPGWPSRARASLSDTGGPSTGEPCAPALPSIQLDEEEAEAEDAKDEDGDAAMPGVWGGSDDAHVAPWVLPPHAAPSPAWSEPSEDGGARAASPVGGVRAARSPTASPSVSRAPSARGGASGLGAAVAVGEEPVRWGLPPAHGVVTAALEAASQRASAAAASPVGGAVACEMRHSGSGLSGGALGPDMGEARAVFGDRTDRDLREAAASLAGPRRVPRWLQCEVTRSAPAQVGAGSWVSALLAL
jgi:hypothetical protein